MKILKYSCFSKLIRKLYEISKYDLFNAPIRKKFVTKKLPLKLTIRVIFLVEMLFTDRIEIQPKIT